MARHKKTRERVGRPTIVLRCECGARAFEGWLSDGADGVTLDGYEYGGWTGPTPTFGTANIDDPDWFRFQCKRCRRTVQGRRVQLAGLAMRARNLNQDRASLEFLPSPQAAYDSGARDRDSPRWY